MSVFDNWYQSVIGQPVDIDGYYGDQCVDLDMSWSEYRFKPHKWPELLGFGNATDLFRTASPVYFGKIPYSAGVVPQQGDMGVIAGHSGNPEGHTYVVISATASSQHVIEQNGYNPSGVAYTTDRGYSYVIGFLRPKGAIMYPNKGDVTNFHNNTGWPGHDLSADDFSYWTQGTGNPDWGKGADAVWKAFMYEITEYVLKHQTGGQLTRETVLNYVNSKLS